MSLRAVESARLTGASESAALWQALAALREVESGDATGGHGAADAAIALNSGTSVKLLAGLALARSGDTIHARVLADEIAHDFPDSVLTHYWASSIRASMALAQNEPTRAIELLQESRKL